MSRVISLVVGMSLFLFAGIAGADDKKETVIEMMNNAVGHYEEVGQEQAFKDFSVKGSEYNQGEFYVFITEMKDRNLIFHGANEKLVGKNLEKLKDTDGKNFVTENAGSRRKLKVKVGLTINGRILKRRKLPRNTPTSNGQVMSILALVTSIKKFV